MLFCQESTPKFALCSPALKKSFPALNSLYIDPDWSLYRFKADGIRQLKVSFTQAFHHNPVFWNLEVKEFAKVIRLANQSQLNYLV